MLPLDAKLVMLSRLSESVEVELGPKWFSSLSDLSSLSSLSRALFALPTVFQRELPGMLTAVVKLPHPTTPTATTVDDSDGVKNLCWELIDRGEGLQSPAPVFAALEARRWDCVQILLGDKVVLHLVCCVFSFLTSCLRSRATLCSSAGCVPALCLLPRASVPCGPVRCPSRRTTTAATGRASCAASCRYTNCVVSLLHSIVHQSGPPHLVHALPPPSKGPANSHTPSVSE
jgi:hypothetical protein